MNNETLEKEIDINYDSLLKQGLVVIDLRYKQYSCAKNSYKYVIGRIEKNEGDFYINMIKDFTGKVVENTKVYDIWSQILLHKYQMSASLKRDISIKVAALDFYETHGI
jgi:hypothetical protein